MDYYARLKLEGYDFERVKVGSKTRIYLLINVDGEFFRIPIFGKTKGGKPVFYSSEFSSSEGALVELQCCKLYSKAYKAMKALYEGLDDLIRENDEYIEREISKSNELRKSYPSRKLN